MGSRLEATPQGHCPHLGLLADRTLIFSEPIEDHRCYVSGRAQAIDFQHQATFCLTSACTSCPRYVAVPAPVPVARPAPQPPVLQEAPQDGDDMRGGLSRASKPQLAVLAVLGLALALAALYLIALRPRDPAPTSGSPAVALAAPSATLAPPTGTAPAATATPSPGPQLIAVQSTPILPPTPTLQAGQPATLLGNPVVEAEDKPDIGAGTHAIAFGNFRAGYLIAERTETMPSFSHQSGVMFTWPTA